MAKAKITKKKTLSKKKPIKKITTKKKVVKRKPRINVIRKDWWRIPVWWMVRDNTAFRVKDKDEELDVTQFPMTPWIIERRDMGMNQ